MKKLVLALIVSSSAAAMAFGHEVKPCEIVDGAGGASLTAVVANPVAYSNLNFSGYAYSTTPGMMLGDDMQLAATGVLQEISFSVFNGSDTSFGTTVQSADIDIYFINDDTGVIIDAITFSSVLLDLAPGQADMYTVNNLGWMGIDLPQNILVGMVVYNNVGGEEFGQLLADPPTVGSSYDWAFEYDGATLDDFNFGGAPNPAANFYWEVVVPEPASLSLIGLAALGLIRRR